MGYCLEEFEEKRIGKEQKFLTVPEVAKRYRTNNQVIYRWVSEKRFPENVVLRLGRKILFHCQNLEAFETRQGSLFTSQI